MIYDREKALYNFSNDKLLFKEVTKLFFKNTEDLATKIQNAIACNDSKSLERLANRLKDSISNFAAKNAFEAALELEKIGREDDLTNVEEAYATLEKEIERLKSALAKSGKKDN
jgi:HPt (histidine-containing phosphotransfer) domain-containing protein